MSFNKNFFVKYDLEIRTFISLFLTLPLLIGHILHLALGHAHHFNGATAVFLNIVWNPIFGLIVATIVQFILGFSYYKKMYYEIFKWKRLGMNTLVGISTILAYVWSLYQLSDAIVNQNFKGDMFDPLFIESQTTFMYFFEVGATLITILLIGNLITKLLKKKLSKDINYINKLLSKTYLKYDFETKTINELSIKKLKIGDYILINNGSKIPTDGQLLDASAIVNEASITGEAADVNKIKDDYLIGGTINMGSPFYMIATKDVENCMLKGIINKLNDLKKQKPKIQKIVDKVSMYFTPVVLSLGLLCFLIMFLFGYEIQQFFKLFDSDVLPSFQQWNNNSVLEIANSSSSIIMNNLECAIYYAITTIVIACPCALGLAAPLALLIGFAKSNKNGIIFNKLDIFENYKKLSLIAFDKTGTLTTGRLEVSSITGDLKYLDLVYSVEKYSNHPIAKSICEYIENKHKISQLAISDISEIPGVGIQAQHEKQLIQICSVDSNIYKKSKINQELENTYLENAQKILIKSTFSCLVNNVPVLYFVLEDKIKTDSKLIISKLRNQKIEPVMISGDNLQTVKYVADQLGIEKYYANCSPYDKERILSELKTSDNRIGFVGDGVNDILALQKADISFNIATHNDMGSSVSDVTLLDHDLINVYKALVLVKFTKNNIWRNLFWTFGYNIVAIPLAFFGLIPALIAVILMFVSDISILSNSLLLSQINPFKKLNKELQNLKSEIYLLI